MGFLSKITDRVRKGQDVPMIVGDGKHNVACVGESNYVPALLALVGATAGETDIDTDRDDVVVAFAVEPSNQYDRNAIRVCTIEGDTLAYFSREDALSYRPAVVELGGIGACSARIRGGLYPDGWRIGIWLDLPRPAGGRFT